jgi:hypothetical protein
MCGHTNTIPQGFPRGMSFFHRFPSQHMPQHFPSLRLFHRNTCIATDAAIFAMEGARKTECVWWALRCLPTPLAPCTLLKPVLQFFGLA